MNKKQKLINDIKNFDSKYFNDDQKTIAIDILEKAPETQVQEIADFIFMKRRTGFAFDYSPEMAKGRLITLIEEKNKRINVNDKIEGEENKLIIGDNYNALKALLLTHKNKIDVIYIDPPYNTEAAKQDGNQSSKEGSSSKFIYKDKFGRGGWLNMMKSRLTLAKTLLSKSGVIFISIDDTEQAYLKVLMDYIFGEENFMTSFIWQRTHHSNRNNSGKKIFRNAEYIHVYCKKNTFLNLFNEGIKSSFDDAPLKNKSNNLHELIFPKKTIFFKKQNQYNSKPLKIKMKSRWNQNKVNEEIKNGTTFIIKANNFDSIRAIYSKNKSGYIIPNQLLNTSDIYMEKYKNSTTENGTNELNSIIGEQKFDYPKPVELIEYLINLIQKKDCLVLDFFAGSGTTGHAVMSLNSKDNGSRKFILSTNNENNIAYDITFERLHRLIKGKGTKNEKDFSWLQKNNIYKKEKLRVINIDDNIKIDLNTNVDDIVYKNCLNGIKLLDKNYNKKSLNLYYDLSALNPLESKKDKF